MEQNAAVTADVLRPLRDAVDTAVDQDRAAFARAARNAVARTILAAAMAPDAVAERPAKEPPEAEIRELLGPELGGALAALYRGGDDWTSRAIALLVPLNDVARGITTVERTFTERW